MLRPNGLSRLTRRLCCSGWTAQLSAAAVVGQRGRDLAGGHLDPLGDRIDSAGTHQRDRDDDVQALRA
jgi:hypothetical protein